MASLPLFSPSFMPKDGASFTSPRPATSTAPPNRAEPVVDRPRDAKVPAGRTLSPVMRSLFDPMPPPLPLPTGTPSDRKQPSTRALSAPGRAPNPNQPSIVEPASHIGHPSSAARPLEARPDPVLPASPVARTEATLREAGFSGHFWRGDALSAASLPARPSGFRALDEQLPGGGWPVRCMTELLLSQAGVGEIRLLASTLSTLTQEGREIVLLSPPHIPDPIGWEQLGIDMRRVLIVRTPRPVDRLWAVEESLKSDAFGALIAWLPEERTLARHDTLRRLQLAAATSNGLSFVMRPMQARHHASPAPLRLALSVGRPEGHRQTISVQLLKRRGPVLTRPLTLTLPQIHRGVKAFSPAEPVDTPKKPISASHPSVSSSISTHALAGSVLSDTRA